ncbi:unnamed protein product, partial [Mesorhabditis spiculigera]
MWDGFLCCLLASILFGSVFVPMRRHPMGDGYYAQLFFSLGAFLITFPIGIYYPPTVYPLVMFGGALWCFANSFCVGLMNKIGMAQAILIWNTSSCLTGWATARFGLFGVDAQLPASELLNYIGVLLLLIGAVFYLFIKSNAPGSAAHIDAGEKKLEKEVAENAAHLPLTERLLTMVCCLLVGTLFGSFYTPVSYLQSLGGYPTAALDYIFSFFIGVVGASATIFFVYTYAKRGKPELNQIITIPSFYGGLMFGAGICFFMIANEKLSPTVAYPTVAMLPGLVVSLWSVLYFKEITGNRNITLLAVAYSLTLINNAGVTDEDMCNKKPGFLTQDMQSYDYIFQINVRCVVFLSREATPHLEKTKGAIVNMSSIAASEIQAIAFPYYGMSKSALDSLTRSLALELIRKGIRVNGIKPGAVSSNIMQKQGATDEVLQQMEKKMSSSFALIPAGFYGKPEDIAHLTAFLCDSEQSRYIIGQSIRVDGGTSLVCPMMLGEEIASVQKLETDQ